MAFIRITVDAPTVQAAALAHTEDFLHVAQETVRLVRGQLPTPGATTLESLAIFDSLDVAESDELTFDTFYATGVAAEDPTTVTGISADSELIHVIDRFETQVDVAGAAAGNVAVAGIDPDIDRLVFVGIATEADPPTITDVTDEFTISAADQINNTGGTASTGETLVVVYQTEVDLTVEFTVTDDDEITQGPTPGTNVVGDRLQVTWVDRVILP